MFIIQQFCQSAKIINKIKRSHEEIKLFLEKSSKKPLQRLKILHGMIFCWKYKNSKWIWVNCPPLINITTTASNNIIHAYWIQIFNDNIHKKAIELIETKNKKIIIANEKLSSIDYLRITEHVKNKKV